MQWVLILQGLHQDSAMVLFHCSMKHNSSTSYFAKSSMLTNKMQYRGSHTYFLSHHGSVDKSICKQSEPILNIFCKVKLLIQASIKHEMNYYRDSRQISKHMRGAVEFSLLEHVEKLNSTSQISSSMFQNIFSN